MKKLINFLCTLCLFAALSSCNKDKDVIPENQITSTEADNTAFEKRTCGHQEHMDKLLADPEYQKQHQAKFTKLENFVSPRSVNCDEPTLLAVAVHFQGISNPDIACLRQLAQSQIDIINADYQGTNDDISNWDNSAAQYFPGISNGDACLNFCLATQNHPSGYGLNNGDLAVTVNQTSGDNVSAWSGYINIFVRPNLGYLGYSPLGGSGNGDGVVVDAAAFGSGSGCTGVSPNAPYDLGRTLTHELGHYLLLDHIWGGNGGCNDDDQVNDTPVSTQEYYGCPNLGVSSCNSNDMHMSYMDYTNDACMYMFSAGQITRVENYIATSLQNVVNTAATTCGNADPPGPTCNDGIQNGDETGVDCGGSCSPCDIPATCDDGIQNGDETGIDCGGSECPPCEINSGCTTPTNITATILDPNTVEISWNAVPEAIKYRVRYRPQGTSQWVNVNTTNTYKVLNNLQTGTTYQYRVRTICADERSPWSAIATFSTDDSGDDECLKLNFSLTVDAYGNETTWDLVSENGATIANGGPYWNSDEGDVINDDWCLDDGCYTLTVYDDWGDGICCDYGYGSYQVTDNDGNVLFYSDGQFGYSETIEFCIEGAFFGNLNTNKDARRSNVKKKKRNRTAQD